MTGPAILPLDLYLGDTAKVQVRLWSDVAHTVPLPLDDVSARAHIRQGDDFYPFLTVITLPNIINLQFGAAAWVASAFSPGRANWDLELEYTDGTILTVLAGAVQIDGDIVQPVAIIRRKSA